METRALHQARAELAATREAAARLGACKDYAEFCRVWTTFLTAQNRVFLKLQKGAQPNAKSRQWMGGKRRERGNDPLLQYLHQARNADEHGLEGVSTLQPGSVGLGIAPGFGAVHIRSMVTSGDGTVVADTYPPGALQVTHTPETAKLHRVYDDRSDRWYETPMVHMGTPIDGTAPTVVAAATLVYLEALVHEAERLPWLA